ncbi:MAG: cardiolipin synthase B, partial [Acidobacteria bacterium]|nr:cardiolipin synthase B [Acidobacteriota bacterium]
DGLWARVGSTNLNLQSWMGNWELDVAIEDTGVAADLERMFVRDLDECTEVVLDQHRRRIQPVPPRPADGTPPGAPGWGRWRRRRGRRGSSGKAAAGALRLGNTVGAALTARRSLGAAEAPTLVTGGAMLLGIAGLAAWWPALLAYPLAGLAVWLGLSLLAAAWRTWSGRS